MPYVDGVLSSVNFAVLQGWIPDYGAQTDRHGNASAGQVSLKMQGRAFTAKVRVRRMIRALSRIHIRRLRRPPPRRPR